MNQAVSRIRNNALWLWMDRRAQDLVEYSLAAGFVAVAASAVFPPAIAPSISSIFQAVIDVMPNLN